MSLCNYCLHERANPCTRTPQAIDCARAGETKVAPQKLVYLIGSLRNSYVPELGAALREHDIEVFDDWYAAGPEADDKWQQYETYRGRTYGEALEGKAVRNVFQFDRRNLDACTDAVLVMPGGKSAHLELGYCIGRGKKGYVLFDKEPERWDAMYRFAHQVFFKEEDLIDCLVMKL